MPPRVRKNTTPAHRGESVAQGRLHSGRYGFCRSTHPIRSQVGVACGCRYLAMPKHSTYGLQRDTSASRHRSRTVPKVVQAQTLQICMGNKCQPGLLYVRAGQTAPARENKQAVLLSRLAQDDFHRWLREDYRASPRLCVELVQHPPLGVHLGPLKMQHLVTTHAGQQQQPDSVTNAWIYPRHLILGLPIMLGSLPIIVPQPG